MEEIGRILGIYVCGESSPAKREMTTWFFTGNKPLVLLPVMQAGGATAFDVLRADVMLTSLQAGYLEQCVGRRFRFGSGLLVEGKELLVGNLKGLRVEILEGNTTHRQAIIWSA